MESSEGEAIESSGDDDNCLKSVSGQGLGRFNVAGQGDTMDLSSRNELAL